MLNVVNFRSLHHINPLRRYFFHILYSDDRSNNNNRIVCFSVDWDHKGIFCDHRNCDSDSITYSDLMALKIFKLFLGASEVFDGMVRHQCIYIMRLFSYFHTSSDIFNSAYDQGLNI